MKIIADERYKKLSDAEKQKVITKAKDIIKDGVFKKYKFTYKQEPTKKNPVIDNLAK
jgi:hypothetical protein